jgi:transposase
VVRGLLTDAEWEFFRPFLTERGVAGGRPPSNHRRVLDAIFWIARTGAPWRDLPAELGNWNSVWRQFRRWTESGIWEVLLQALADAGGRADAVQMIDSTIVRAHHCAAGAKGGLRTRVLAARGVASRPRSTFAPIARVCRSGSS